MKNQFNYFYCNVAIQRAQFESIVKVPYKNKCKKEGFFSYGYYKVTYND